jgi:hypothetical protein
MSVKPSEEEEKYFKTEDQRRIAEMRGEIQADEATKQTWLSIARGVGSEDLAVGRQLSDLGFNAETAKILFFVPLIEVAWADGKIGYEESYKLVDMVRQRGMRATSEAFDFLSKLTLNRPDAAFFDGANQVIRQVLSSMPGTQRDAEINNLADLCVQVATASRGFFGFGAAVSKEERDAIQDIIRDLGLENSSKASELLKSI